MIGTKYDYMLKNKKFLRMDYPRNVFKHVDAYKRLVTVSKEPTKAKDTIGTHEMYVPILRVCVRVCA